MDNPFSKLSHGQILAVIAGGVAVTGYALYKHHEDTGSWSPFSSGSSSSSTSSTSQTTSTTTIDPVTGLPYSEDDATDPETGMTYLSEAEEYGSVEAADAALGYGTSAAAEAEISDQGPYGDEYTGLYTPVGDSASTDVYTSNSAWAQAVTAGLTDIGYTSTDVSAAIGAYLTGTPLTADQVSIVNAAIAEYGKPPVGNLQVIQQPAATPSTTTTGSSGASAATVTVPSVIGRTDLSYAESLIKAAGLTPENSPNSDSAAGNTGKVTSQSPAGGTKVPPGTKVTLTYTDNKADNPTVAVPNQVGRTDLSYAEQQIENAGLKVKATGNLSKAKGNKGKVTAQSPKAGTKVAKGTTVTLTYE